jgi:hypothetical protein
LKVARVLVQRSEAKVTPAMALEANDKLATAPTAILS